MGLTERKKSGRIFDGSLLNVPGQGILTKKIQSSFTKNLPYRPEGIPPVPTPSVTPVITPAPACDFTGMDVSTATPTPTATPDTVPPPVQGPPTIIVDMEPPTVRFTQMDTVFDTENPEKNMIRFAPEGEENEEISEIEIDMNAPAESLDEFENLEDGADTLGTDEFETL
jgi:hypothetical protein